MDYIALSIVLFGFLTLYILARCGESKAFYIFAIIFILLMPVQFYSEIWYLKNVANIELGLKYNLPTRSTKYLGFCEIWYNNKWVNCFSYVRQVEGIGSVFSAD